MPGRLLAILLMLFAVAAFANNVSSTWYTRSWQSDDGLPDNSVSGVAQTSDGYLWVATAGGLMRFDGARFQEFPLANLDGVPNRVVRAMLLDRRGWLWLGMDRGPVVCIAPKSTKVFVRGLPDARATSMVDDAQGDVWIAYGDGGLSRLQPDGQVRIFGAADGWSAENDSSLACDVAGQLWFAEGNRVGIFQGGKFQTLLTFPETVWSISRRRAGGIWICSGRQLLHCDSVGGKPELFGQLPVELNGIQSQDMLEDRNGALWIGTLANGLFRCNGTNTVLVPTSYREIACLTQDREGDIWAGTAGGGLDRLRPRIIELLGPESGLPYESVRSICEDTLGAIWVTMQNGALARWQNSSWSTLPKGTNVPSGYFSCVVADPHGGLWIGTRDHGFYHFQDGQCRNWQQSDGLTTDNVRSILVATNGDVYITTDGPSRLQRLRDGKLEVLKMPVQPRSLRALVEDAAGRVWVGSADGLLLRVEGNHLLDETPGVTDRLLSIRSLLPTPDGSLWIGYAGWGIGRLKDGHYTRMTAEQGLNDDYVSQMVTDDLGWLWCAGNRGIFEVRLQQLKDLAAGKISRVRSTAYGGGEGFPNLQANYENSPGAMRSRDGRIWFPMHIGLAIIHADRVLNNAPPPVLLERVTMDGRTVAIYDRYQPAGSGHPLDLSSRQSLKAGLRLLPSYRKLSFEFTALSFRAPENVRFQYRLEGFDESWNEAGTTRNVSYSRLPPGHYHFLVRASNPTGEWDQIGAEVDFEVMPFYWQTWWFRSVVLVVFTLSVVAIVRYVSFRRLHHRLHLLEQQAALQRERARIAKDIHDDLGADLTQIAFLGELAFQDRAEPEKATERIYTISATARQAVRSLDEIVWAVNPRNDTLVHLIDYAGQFAVDYLRIAGIRCRVDFPDQIPARELSTDLRHNLFLVIKEALHNIVKHAAATEVWLRANISEKFLEVTIEDNGHGFDNCDQTPDDALADGLRNMRQRMTDIGGECHFESHPGSGTRVILRLPWTKDDSNVHSIA